MKHRPSQAMAYFVLSGAAIFSVLYLVYLVRAVAGTQPGWFVLGILGFKTSVEIIASFYGFAFLFGSIFYLVRKEAPEKAGGPTLHTPVGIICLCCDDLDNEAMESVAVDSPEYSPVNRLLSRSINAFHVFFSVQSKFGWQPFIGHNAFLRLRAVREVGGFTPGFFSDDLDLTVRLNLKGYGVVYAPEIRIGEKHLPSYTSFRKRSY